VTRFRTETDTGHHYEFEAVNDLAARAETLLREAEAGSRPDVRVTSLWYFREDIGQWVSGDELLEENEMGYAERILEEIRGLRERPESRETEAEISGLKRALEIFMGNDSARQFLTGNGESSN
jgi:hypothetical protein